MNIRIVLLALATCIHVCAPVPIALNWVLKRQDTEQRAEPSKRSDCPNACLINDLDRQICLGNSDDRYDCEREGCCFDPNGATTCFTKRVVCDDNEHSHETSDLIKDEKKESDSICVIEPHLRVDCFQNDKTKCMVMGCCWDELDAIKHAAPKCFYSNRAIFLQDRYIDGNNNTNGGPPGNEVPLVKPSFTSITTESPSTTRPTTTPAVTTQQSIEQTSALLITEEPYEEFTTAELTTQGIIAPSTTNAPTSSTTPPNTKEVTLYCAKTPCRENELMMEKTSCESKGCCASEDINGIYNGCFKYTWTPPSDPTEYRYSTLYYVPLTTTKQPTTSTATSTTATTQPTTSTVRYTAPTSKVPSSNPPTTAYNTPNVGTSNIIYPTQPAAMSTFPDMLLCIVNRKFCMVKLLTSLTNNPGTGPTINTNTPRRPVNLFSPQIISANTQVSSSAASTQTQQNGIPKSGDDNIIQSDGTVLQASSDEGPIMNSDNSETSSVNHLASQNRMWSPSAAYSPTNNIGTTSPNNPRSNPFGSLFNFGMGRSNPVPPPVQTGMPSNVNSTIAPMQTQQAMNNAPMSPFADERMMSMLCPMLSGKNSKICDILPMIQSGTPTEAPPMPKSTDWINLMVSLDDYTPPVDIFKLLKSGDSGVKSREMQDPIYARQCHNAKQSQHLYVRQCRAYTQESCEKMNCCWSGDLYTSMLMNRESASSPLMMMMMQSVIGAQQQGGKGPSCIKRMSEEDMERILMLSIMSEVNATEEFSGVPMQTFVSSLLGNNQNTFGAVSPMGGGNNMMNMLYPTSNSMSKIMSILPMLQKGNSGSSSSSGMSNIMSMLPMLQGGSQSSSSSSGLSSAMSLLGKTSTAGSSSSMSNILSMLPILQGSSSTGSSFNPEINNTPSLGGMSSLLGSSNSMSNSAFTDLYSKLLNKNSGGSTISAALQPGNLASMFSGLPRSTDSEHSMEE